MTIGENIKVDSKNEPKKKFDLDDVLTHEVGHLGKYQIIAILLTSFPCIFAAASSGEYIFTTERISTRCVIPQCDGERPEFAPAWLLHAIPGSSASSFDNCARYANSSLADDADAADACPARWFDAARTEPCHAYVYQNTLSIVYDFELACQEWKRSQIGSIRTIGTILVQPITGYISDRWGRRVALILNALNTAWLGLARSFVHSYEWFLITEVVEAAIGGGAYTTCYILVTEMVGPKRRVAAGATMSTLYALGQVFLGLIAWSLPSWRPLTRAIYAPQLLVVTYFWILPESIRWLLSKGRYNESEVILNKVAKVNNRSLSDKSLQELRAAAASEKSKEKLSVPWLPVQVVRSRSMLLRCVVTPFIWIATTLVYYGMTINAVNLSGNRYLNYVYVSLIEIPGYWTAILLLDHIGRKLMLIGGFWLCASCQLAFILIPIGYNGLSLTFYLVGKYAIAAVVTSVYVFTAELYPTKYRHNLFAFTSMLGRLGSITAPLTPALALTVWEHFPSALFGGFALLAGLLIFFLPETLGIKLPDTMEEAEQLGFRK